LKLKISTVRKARMTGYNGKNRKRKGCIYLPADRIGNKVLIITVQEYRKMAKQIRKGGTKLSKVQKIIKGGM
jgi:hypothetical protein